MSELAPTQKARLESAFAQVDALLGEVTRSIDPAMPHSPWSRNIADLTPLQQQMIAEGAQHLRIAMREILERNGLAPPVPHGSAAQDCRAALNHVLVAIEALGPHGRGGGEALSDESESELHRIVARLLEPLDHMQQALSDGAIAGIGDDTLGELQRIIVTHGLAQLRAPVAALIERVQAQDFMIALFGSVNAGKSSLLNHLLGSPVLPVGAMPATVVPVLLRHGGRARGVAQFADAAPEVFTPDRLAEFAAEHFNPGNARHVTRLLVELPATRLEHGITLVDMPGLSPGAAAEVPPCDLGIVLIDVTGSLALAEAELVAALQRSGSQVLILLSKADRLGEQDRWNIYGHVTSQLLARSGMAPRVYFASSAGDNATLHDDWIVRGLEPCIAQRQVLRDTSLRCKTGVLREAVIAALERRLASPPVHAASARAQDALAQGREVIDQAMQHRFAAGAEARRQTSRLLREVAHNAAVLASHDNQALLDITPMLAASVQARAHAAARDVALELRKLAAECGNALAQAGSLSAAQSWQAGQAPDFDGVSQLPTVVLRRPWFAALGGWSVRESVWRALLRRGLRGSIGELLAAYLTQLAAWRADALEQLQRGFSVESERLRGQADRITQDIETLRGNASRPVDAIASGWRPAASAAATNPMHR